MTEVLAQLEKIAQAPADDEVRIVRRIEIGSVLHQGDVYVHRVSADHPRGEQIGVDCVQVALVEGKGALLKGASHKAVGEVKVFRGVQLPPGVEAPSGVPSAEITGPLIVADDVWHLSHNEHTHFRIPAGVYQVTYQVDFSTMHRVLD